MDTDWLSRHTLQRPWRQLIPARNNPVMRPLWRRGLVLVTQRVAFTISPKDPYE